MCLAVQSLDRCYALDEMLARLARTYPETKFLRARAAALGFASAGTSSSRTKGFTRLDKMPGRFVDDDEEDPYADGAVEKAYYDDEEEADDEEDDVDTDMLPTLLVYRDGELVHNWVRVDWEAGAAGVEDLLARWAQLVMPFHPQISHLFVLRRHVISGSMSGGNCGLPEDEGEDLIWSDEEDTKR